MTRFLVLIALVCALAACDLKREAVTVQSYLPNPPSARATQVQALDARAGRFDVAPAFAGKPLVWRLGETRYESDFYNELLVAPRALVMDRTEQWFGLRGATEQHRLPPPRYILEAYVHELYGDVRSAPGRAQLRIRFTLTSGGEKPTVVFEREYSESANLAGATAENLVRAYGVAIDRALARVQTDLKSLP